MCVYAAVVSNIFTEENYLNHLMLKCVKELNAFLNFSVIYIVGELVSAGY